VNRIGIDLGGTKIEAVALAPDGTEVFRERVPTPGGDYRGIIDAIAALVARAEAAAAPTQGIVGVGTPGAISPLTGLLKNSNSTVLIGRPFDRDLEQALGRPLVMRNDAD
jgi:fructokinase